MEKIDVIVKMYNAKQTIIGRMQVPYTQQRKSFLNEVGIEGNN